MNLCVGMRKYLASCLSPLLCLLILCISVSIDVPLIFWVPLMFACPFVYLQPSFFFFFLITFLYKKLESLSEKIVLEFSSVLLCWFWKKKRIFFLFFFLFLPHFLSMEVGLVSSELLYCSVVLHLNFVLFLIGLYFYFLFIFHLSYHFVSFPCFSGVNSCLKEIKKSWVWEIITLQIVYI